MNIDPILSLVAKPAVVALVLAIALYFAIKAYTKRREKGILFLALAVGLQVLFFLAIALFFRLPDWSQRNQMQKLLVLSQFSTPVLMIIGWMLLARNAPTKHPQPSRPTGG